MRIWYSVKIFFAVLQYYAGCSIAKVLRAILSPLSLLSQRNAKKLDLSIKTTRENLKKCYKYNYDCTELVAKYNMLVSKREKCGKVIYLLPFKLSQRLGKSAVALYTSGEMYVPYGTPVWKVLFHSNKYKTPQVEGVREAA